MSNLLKSLYYSSSEGISDYSKELSKRDEVHEEEIGDALKSALGADHRALFYEYESAMNAVSNAECYESFCKGYSLCLRLIMDGLTTKI